MSDSDFTLDINNPKEPKVLCVGNNPDRISIYGAALGPVSYTHLHTVQFHGLPLFHQIIHCRPSLRVGKEIIVQPLNPFPFRVQFHRLYGLNVSFLFTDEAERAFADAAS